MARHIHRFIRKASDSDDPYRDVKKRCNQFVLDLLPELRDMIACAENRFETAVRMAIAGNVIDFGVYSDMNEEQVLNTVKSSLTDPLFGDAEAFYDAVQSAQTILYLGDNAGEIVFDRLLIEHLPRPDGITFAVRGGPVINDALLEDADQTGVANLARVIDSGVNAPGVILPECSDRFRRVFDKADLIIAKGQGNYETLSDTDRPVFFLLKAKCPVIARRIGCCVRDGVIVRTSI